VNLPDQEMHTTSLWWQLPQHVLDERFASRQDALDGFLGAAYALHVVAKVAVMADAADLQKSVGSGDGAWFATADGRGRGQLRTVEGHLTNADMHDRFVPTVYLYDNYPGGVGQSEPLWRRQHELVVRARELIALCDCKSGCPACVGPVLTAHEEAATSLKGLAMSVLSALEAA
jgi:DEAD/DEAH box helicase domain-containing protein